MASNVLVHHRQRMGILRALVTMGGKQGQPVAGGNFGGAAKAALDLASKSSANWVTATSKFCFADCRRRRRVSPLGAVPSDSPACATTPSWSFSQYSAIFFNRVGKPGRPIAIQSGGKYVPAKTVSGPGEEDGHRPTTLIAVQRQRSPACRFHPDPAALHVIDLHADEVLVHQGGNRLVFNDSRPIT